VTHHRDVITALNGTQIDITPQVSKLLWIGNPRVGDMDLTPKDRKFIIEFGRKLVLVGGPACPVDLIETLAHDGDITEEFANHLRTAWGSLAEKWECLSTA
jgi:hypothetical protein